MKRKILTKDFFERSALIVARELLGKFLVRRIRGKEVAYMITEVEAYEGPSDLASHAARGKTARNAPMWGEAGYLYVYLVYGMHEMLNVVTGKHNYPAAILVRGVVGVNGPGRVSRALKVVRTMSGKRATPETGLWFEDRHIRIAPRQIMRTARVGVAYAGEWANKPYRYLILGEKLKTTTTASRRARRSTVQ